MEDNNTLKINLRKMIPDNIASTCAYCKDPLTNIQKKDCYKYYLYLKSIPIDIYEEMAFKGWTKCGDRIYLHSYEKSCCKLYQPRININNFQISNEQKKIMKRFRKYLAGEYKRGENVKKEENKPKKVIIEDNFKNNISKKVQEYINSQNIANILKKYIKKEEEIQIYLNKIKEAKIRRITNKKYNFNYSCDLIYIIKKVYSSIINIKNTNNNINTIINKDENDNIIKLLINDLYNNFKDNYKSNEEIISYSEETGHINFQIKNQIEYQKFLDEEVSALTGKINNININKNNNNNEIKKDIIKENIEKEDNKGKVFKNKKGDKKNDVEVNKKEKYVFDCFPEIVQEPDIFLPLKHTYTFEVSKNIILEETEERFLLYKKYEETIHKEKNVMLKDHNSYWGNSILEKSKKIPFPQNLKDLTPHPEIYPEFYGQYNFIHRIDNKIVAVTIVEILPHSFISVYCYYDPDYSFLDLGVITVIREIEYMKSFNKLIDNNFIYYTMGEMCQTCQKLKYKGNYRPTEIMDNFTGKYIYLTEEIKKIIGDNKCHFLADNEDNSPIKHFSLFEIEDKFFNLMVNVFGEKVYLDNFFDLYLEGDENLKNRLSFNLKRFLEIIDKDLYNKIEFYYEITPSFFN